MSSLFCLAVVFVYVDIYHFIPVFFKFIYVAIYALSECFEIVEHAYNCLLEFCVLNFFYLFFLGYITKRLVIWRMTRY